MTIFKDAEGNIITEVEFLTAKIKRDIQAADATDNDSERSRLQRDIEHNETRLAELGGATPEVEPEPEPQQDTEDE